MLKHATKVCPNATSEEPFHYFGKSYNKKLGIDFLAKPYCKNMYTKVSKTASFLDVSLDYSAPPP